MWGARLQRPWKRSRTVPVYTKVASFKMECVQLTLAWLTFHYERLMGLVRQRSEAFGPVHYEGYIWHWSARQPIALHCWVPTAPDVRWAPGPRSFNRAGIVLYLNSLAFSFFRKKKTQPRTCSYTCKQVEENVHQTVATPHYTLPDSNQVWRWVSSTNKLKHVGVWLLSWT